MTESDTELIRRAQAEDIDAFCLLAQRYARRIHLLAFHYCRNAHDAEDLSQEVWLKAYQALRTLRSDVSFYSWLRRITVNTFLNHRRSTRFRRNGQTTPVQLVQIDTQPLESRLVSPENIYNKLLFENVVEALADLTPLQRLAFLLRHYEGMSYEEVANAMNCSQGTVKKGVSRAIGKLRARLSPEAETHETLTSETHETLTSLANEY